jgi:hypothetical protein
VSHFRLAPVGTSSFVVSRSSSAFYQKKSIQLYKRLKKSPRRQRVNMHSVRLIGFFAAPSGGSRGANPAMAPPIKSGLMLWPPAKTRKRNDLSGVLENTVNFHTNVYTFTNVMVQTSIQQRFSAVLTFAFMILQVLLTRKGGALRK